MNIRNYEELIEKKLNEIKGKCIFLYGAKNMGDIAYKLLRHYHVEVAGYIVSGDAPNSACMNNVPIYGLNEFCLNCKDNVVVILTLNKMYHGQVISALRDKGIVHIDDTFFEYQHYFFADLFERLFRQNNIDLSKGTMEIGDYRQLNPYIHPNMASFFLEAGDLILPALLNNYDFIIEGPYENENVALTEGDVVLDCGANIGLFSCYAASRKCTTYAFEPIGGNLAETLAYHIRLHSPLMRLVPYALADGVGQMEMNVASFADCGASLVSNKYTDSSITVETTTIDHFVKEARLDRVDFIKADIEGAERLMLAGAKETLRKFTPKLAICTYHLPDDPQVLEAIIKEANPSYHVAHRWKKLFAWT